MDSNSYHTSRQHPTNFNSGTPSNFNPGIVKNNKHPTNFNSGTPSNFNPGIVKDNNKQPPQLHSSYQLSASSYHQQQLHLQQQQPSFVHRTNQQVNTNQCNVNSPPYIHTQQLQQQTKPRSYSQRNLPVIFEDNSNKVHQYRIPPLLPYNSEVATSQRYYYPPQQIKPVNNRSTIIQYKDRREENPYNKYSGQMSTTMQPDQQVYLNNVYSNNTAPTSVAAQQRVYANVDPSLQRVAPPPPDQNHNLNDKVYYQQQPYQIQDGSLQQQQQQQSNYNNQYSVSPPSTYYPYHKENLSNVTSPLPSSQPYAVKSSSGVIHQYPLPDYVSPPPSYSEVPYNNYINKNEYNNSKVYDSSPQPYYGTPKQQQQYTVQNSPSNASPLNQIINKQEGSYQASSSDVSPSYAAYRSGVLDSPLGSPLSAQTSPAPAGVFKTPQATPPMQRREPPIRQISNEVYKLDSPSSQLLLQDMSLNSPRPRAETYDMDHPPLLPPRSPLTLSKEVRPVGGEPPVLNRALPSPNRVVVSTYQDQLQVSNQRVRSGTVEMADSNTLTASGQRNDSRLMLPPSAALTSQLGINNQRTRAGTIEMVDTPQGYNELLGYPVEPRIRSGTVEMCDTPQSYYNTAAVVSPQYHPSQQQQQSQRPPTQQYQQVLPPQQSEVTSQQIPKQQAQSTQQYQPPPVQRQQSQPLQQQSSQQVNQQQVYQQQQSLPDGYSYVQTNDKSVKPPPPYQPTSNIRTPVDQTKLSQNNEPTAYYPQGVPVNTSTYVSQPQSPSAQYEQEQSQRQTGQQQVQTAASNRRATDSPNYDVYSPQGSIPSPQYDIQTQVVDDVMQRKQKIIQATVNNTSNETNSNKGSKTSAILNEEVPASVVDAYVQVYNNSETEEQKFSQQQQQQQQSSQQQQQQQHQQQQQVSQQQQQQQQSSQQQQQPNQQNQRQNTTKDTSNIQQYSDDEVERQQKLMQQQYVQRVRQAQLQQQLREIQNEYQANLQIEQDIAQEFLCEQEVKKTNVQHPGMMAPPNSSHQQINPQQYPYIQRQQYSENIPPNYITKQMPHQNRIPPMNAHRHPQPAAYGGVPPGGLPMNPALYQQMHGGRYLQQQQPRNMSAQPIVIMPGGGSFSNNGQFARTTNLSYQQPPLKDLHLTNPPISTSQRQGSGVKEQTPFQKLRKIAEDISSFVDDVVKFKGKKGDHEYKYLDEMLTQQLLLLDKIASIGTDELRNARKALVKEIQELLEILERRASNPDTKSS